MLHCLLVMTFKQVISLKVKIAQLCPTLCDPMDYTPGQNAGVGSLSLLQGIFPTQGLSPGLSHHRWILYQLSCQGVISFFILNSLTCKMGIKIELIHMVVESIRWDNHVSMLWPWSGSMYAGNKYWLFLGDDNLQSVICLLPGSSPWGKWQDIW